MQTCLEVIAGARTFVPAYRGIAQADGEDWVAHLLTFQNGFVCLLRFAAGTLRQEATRDVVVRYFTGKG